MKTASSKESTRLRVQRAARQLFAAQGFAGTTTRQIARKAGMNEALIFRHFPTKRGLYEAIIQDQINRQSSRSLLQAANDAEGEPADVLRKVAERMFAAVEDDPEFVRILYFSALEGHKMGRQFFDTYVQALTSRLRGFITKQVKAGRFRETDSYLAARMFIGSIAHYLLVEELFPKLQLRRAKARVVGTFVDIFVKGMIARK